MKHSALIIGASGLIGHALMKQWLLNKHEDNEIVGTYHSHSLNGLVHLDYRNNSQVSNLIDRFCPQIILCSAALSNVDWCEEHPEESWDTNVKTIEILVKECKKRGILFVFYSSDYIFDGKEGPYREGDLPSPINIYGKQKLAAENLIREVLGDNHIIVRTTGVYGWEPQGKNFVIRILNALSEGHPVKVPVDQIGNPTYAPSLAEATWKLVHKEMKGTWHLVGKEWLSRYDFALFVAKVFNLNSNLIVPVKTSDLKQKASRPLQGGMLTDKVYQALNLILPGAEESLMNMYQEKRKLCNQRNRP